MATDFLDLDFLYSKDNVKEILKTTGGTFSENENDISHFLVTGQLAAKIFLNFQAKIQFIQVTREV